MLSPTSAQNLTKAQQSALEKALAAGISRDEFEKTRASVVSMLRGAAAAASSGSGNAGKERSVTPQPVAPLSASSTNTTATSADTSLANASEAVDEAAAQRSFDGLPPRLAISTGRRENNGSGSRSARHSLNSASTSTSTSQTALSEPASTAPSTAASTLRTSVSSSNGGEEDRHFANSSTGGLGTGHDSPATSHDGNEGGEDMMQMHLDQSSSSASMAEKGRTRAQTPEKHAILDDEMMLSSVEKSIMNGDIEEDDSSFNAATAAAAALGMLASSPVKVIERRPSSTTTTNNTQYQHQPFMNGASGVFSQHRGHGNGQLVSSSSPPLAARGGGGAGNALAQELSASSSTGHLYSSPSRSPLDNSRLGNDSSDLSAEGLVAAATLGATATLSASGSDADARRRGDKSTTPVRTRLEDIALKSSAQIRRQREILGLGEEEMMDLDTDARHENALLRGQFDADEEEEEEYVDDDSEEMLRRTSSRRQSSRRRNDASGAAESEPLSLRGLAPAFSYPHPASSSSASVSRKASRSPSRPVITNGRDGRSAHSRQSSRHVGAQASSSSHFSPSKLASAHLPSSTHSSHHYASSSVAPPTSSSSTTAVSTSRRRGHHRRVSSFGMSGMMDRFMESNYSPKAAQIAKFEEAVRRASPEREGRSSAHPSSSAYDTDRTLMHAGPEGEDEEEDVYYEEAEDDENAVEDREDVTIHSTPRTHMDKTRLLRVRLMRV